MKQRRQLVNWEMMAALAAVAGGCLFAADARGQNVEFQVRQVTAEFTDTPAITYTGGRASAVARTTTGTSKWLRVEAQYDSAPEWADDVKVEFYVLTSDPQQPMCFTASESYVNVAKGRGHVAAMFVHPKTVQRYMKNQGVRQIAVLLYYQGRLVSAMSNPARNDRWWEQLQPQQGFLLPRKQTPWAVLDEDRYEVPKPAP